MPNYLVEVAFKHKTSSLRPKDQLWGTKRVSIETDKEPETTEEFQEISKKIFHDTPDCEIVKILAVMEDPDKDLLDKLSNTPVNSDIQPFVEGEVIID